MYGMLVVKEQYRAELQILRNWDQIVKFSRRPLRENKEEIQN